MRQFYDGWQHDDAGKKMQAKSSYPQVIHGEKRFWWYRLFSHMPKKCYNEVGKSGEKWGDIIERGSWGKYVRISSKFCIDA
jgi:hypothetical protein